MSQSEYITYHSLLFSVAFKIVGCTATAEDMVHDTFVNWLKTERFTVKDVKSYLIKSVTNTCFNYLGSIRKKKEDLMDNISFSHLKFNPDFSGLDIKCEITHALATVSKKLAPTERAVFVLKGIFNIDYSELPSIVGKTSDNCRQLFSRAQAKLREDKDRFSLDTDHLVDFVSTFKKATLGEFAELIESLKKDINKL